MQLGPSNSLCRPAATGRWLPWLILAGAGLLCVLALDLGAQEPAEGAKEASEAAGLTASELLRESRGAFEAGRYGDAEKLFEQFDRDYGSSEQARAAAAANRPLLALCKVQLKKFDEAGPLIDASLELKDLPQRLRSELGFWRGICFMQSGEYAQAQHAFGRYFQDQTNDRLKRFEALLLFGTCYTLSGFNPVSAEFFAAQIPKLREDPVGQEIAGRAVVLQLHALLQEKNHPAALALVRAEYPHLAEVTQIVSFQALTLELGARFLDEKKWYEAIACLQRVWTRERLERHQTERLEFLQQRLEILRQRPDRRASVFIIQGMIARVERELANFRAMENFDSALRLRLATAFQGLGRYREAALIMEDMLLRLEPDAVVESATLALMQCWMEIARWPKAAETAGIFREKFPDSKHLPLVMFLNGQALQNDERYEEAVAAYTGTVEAFPDSDIAPKAQFMRGFSLLLLNRYEDALEIFARYPDEFPQAGRLIEDAFYWQGMCLSFAEEYAPARDHMEQYLERYADGRYRMEAIFRAAFCTFGLADYAAAIGQFEDFIGVYGDDPLADEARLLLGDALLAEGAIEGGIAVYRSIRPEAKQFFEDGWFKVGKALRLTEDVDGMRAHFEEFLEKYPGSSRMPEAVYWIGWTHGKQGNPDKTKTLYRETLREHGDNPEYFAIADILLALPKLYRGEGEPAALARELDELLRYAESTGRETLAFRALWAKGRPGPGKDESSGRAALLLASKMADPKVHNPVLLADCADALRESGNHLQAEALYKEIRKWHPRAPQKDRVYAGLGKIAQERGDSAAAIRFFERVEKETPASPLLGEVLLAKAALLMQENKLPEARAALDEILEIQAIPSRAKARALFEYGALLSREKELKKAAAYYERIYVVYGKYRDLVAQAYYRRGQVLEELTLPGEALEVYRELAGREDLAEFEETRLARRRAERLELDVVDEKKPAGKGEGEGS